MIPFELKEHPKKSCTKFSILKSRKEPRQTHFFSQIFMNFSEEINIIWLNDIES